MTILSSLFCCADKFYGLYNDLNKLNSDVIARRVILTEVDLESSQDRAKKFLFQHINKKGDLYDNIMSSQENWYARHIHALSINIEASMRVTSIESNASTVNSTLSAGSI